VDDGALIQTIAARGEGARGAEIELFRRYAPRVRLYGLRHLRDEDRARDLVQAVMLAVLEAARAGRVKELDKVDRFVLGTARNTALRVREIEGRGRELVVEEAFEPPLELVDGSALMRCIGKLEERARAVLMLSFMEEQAAEEIATFLSTSAGNVRVMRHRALQAVRTCLDGGAP
jgi:RNA polymerase sigma-70 factor (ECF subfamily)